MTNLGVIAFTDASGDLETNAGRAYTNSMLLISVKYSMHLHLQGWCCLILIVYRYK